MQHTLSDELMEKITSFFEDPSATELNINLRRILLDYLRIELRSAVPLFTEERCRRNNSLASKKHDLNSLVLFFFHLQQQPSSCNASHAQPVPSLLRNSLSKTGTSLPAVMATTVSIPLPAYQNNGTTSTLCS